MFGMHSNSLSMATLLQSSKRLGYLNVYIFVAMTTTKILQVNNASRDNGEN
jgi:hypothetical protein